MELSKNKILITGGASGIGLGIAERFIKENNTVIICGRRQEALDEAKEQLPELIIRQCDLESEAERIALYEWIAKDHSDVNVLVNNAGVQNWIQVADNGFYKKAKQEVSINIMAPLHLTALFIQFPLLKTIINVTSGLAFVPLTKVPVYSATKAFFRSFSLSLRHQLEGAGIEVIEVIPPKLNTDLGGKGLHDDAPPVSDFLDAVFEQLKMGETEIGYALSAEQLKINNEATKAHFNRLNPAL